MDVELAADIFDHDALAGGVVHDVMRLRGEAPSGEHDGGRRRCCRYWPSPRRRWRSSPGSTSRVPTARWSCPHRPPRRACSRRTSGNRTVPVARPFSFTPSNRIGRPAPFDADAGIFRLPLQPVLAVGRRAGARIAARDHHDLGIKVDAEFERARVNDGAVRRDQADAGAGQRRLQALLSSSAQAPRAETSFRAIVKSVIPSLSICNFGWRVSRVALSGHFPDGGFNEPEIAVAGGILHDGSVAVDFRCGF